MENILDIKIIGHDEKRPPRVRKEPYIDLFFKLSSQVPKEWCDDFNKIAKALEPPVKIDAQQGLFIETYVRDMNHIPMHLEKIKRKISICNEQYIESMKQREEAAAAINASLLGQQGEQGKLNAIVAALKFDD